MTALFLSAQVLEDYVMQRVLFRLGRDLEATLAEVSGARLKTPLLPSPIKRYVCSTRLLSCRRTVFYLSLSLLILICHLVGMLVSALFLS